MVDKTAPTRETLRELVKTAGAVITEANAQLGVLPQARPADVFKDMFVLVPDQTGKIQRQGKIVAVPLFGYFLIEWFSFIDGLATFMTIEKVDPMLSAWRFYRTHEEWREAYERSV